MTTLLSTSSSSIATTVADEIVSTLVAFIPALVPFEAPIALGFNLVSNVAPELYAEIKGLVAEIQAGGTPSADEIAALNAIVSQLRNPDDYFAGPLAASLPAPGAGAATTAPAALSEPAAAAAPAAPAVVGGFLVTQVNPAGFHVPA